MNALADARLIERLAGSQEGVFSTADLRTALAERHPSAFTRRIGVLVRAGVLRRFMRGWYVATTFDLQTLSQRIGPGSCVSFGTVLADALLIGTRPQRQVMATRVGTGRTWTGLGQRIVHVSIAPHLDFGWTASGGVRRAAPEKATLDALYFHLRGRRYVFDVYSDIDYERLDRARLDAYLARYRNPRFVAFARRLLDLP